MIGVPGLLRRPRGYFVAREETAVGDGAFVGAFEGEVVEASVIRVS